MSSADFFKEVTVFVTIAWKHYVHVLYMISLHGSYVIMVCRIEIQSLQWRFW